MQKNLLRSDVIVVGVMHNKYKKLKFPKIKKLLMFGNILLIGGRGQLGSYIRKNYKLSNLKVQKKN